MTRALPALALDPTHSEARAQRALLRSNARDRTGAKADPDTLDRSVAAQAQLRLMMSQLYLNLDDPAQAIAQLNQWLPAHPNEVRRDLALHRRCRARARLGVDLDRALDDCDDATGSDEKNRTYLDSREWVYLRMGKHKQALADFDRRNENHPGSAWSLYGRGLTKTRSGNVAQGETDLAAARKVQGDIEERVAKAGLTTDVTARP